MRKTVLTLGILLFLAACAPVMRHSPEKEVPAAMVPEPAGPTPAVSSPAPVEPPPSVAAKETAPLPAVRDEKPAVKETPPAPVPPRTAEPPRQTVPEGPRQEPAPADETSPPSLPVLDEKVAFTIDPPAGDGVNDDFVLEFVPTVRPKKGPTFDIPIVVNARVEQFLQYFQTTARNKFASWLSVSAKYVPFMTNLLREHGLPEDLVYLALIESGFNPNATSPAKACGPWQFIYLTGKRYGLKVDWWVDERRDPEKSTVAAARYLKALYDMFECWYLAAAGYNAGEGKIANAIRRYRTEDFWELAKTPYLKQETRDYVPLMIAAALIAKEPEAYGFTGIDYQEPLRYEKVTLPGGIDLRSIAKALETAEEELRDLNPELLRGCTPPGRPEYELKIPYDKGDLFLKNRDLILASGKVQFKTHKVKKGETPQRIAKNNRVDLDPLLDLNHLKKGAPLSAGSTLLLPAVSSNGSGKAPSPQEPAKKTPIACPEEVTYTIKKGDTLWSIANEMRINIGVLSSWNNLHPEAKLLPGDKLKIRPAAAATENHKAGKDERKEIVYVVRKGDTLWSIAQKHRVTVPEIKTWNRLNGTNRIQPSDRLKIRVRASDL
jgi:membrane-bound lytic murein transglycosylase D